MPQWKTREIANNITSSPPPEAPKWTLDSAWLQGVLAYHIARYILLSLFLQITQTTKHHSY